MATISAVSWVSWGTYVAGVPWIADIAKVAHMLVEHHVVFEFSGLFAGGGEILRLAATRGGLAADRRPTPTGISLICGTGGLSSGTWSAMVSLDPLVAKAEGSA